MLVKRITQATMVSPPLISIITFGQVGSASPDVLTPSSSTIPSTIKLLYGPSVGRELLHITTKAKPAVRIKNANKDDAGESGDDDSDPEWHAEVYASSANYHAKKFTFLLFINRKLWRLPLNFLHNLAIFNRSFV